MKTYLNDKNKYVSEKPAKYIIGKDKLGRNVYNNSILYSPYLIYLNFSVVYETISSYIIKNSIVITDDEKIKFLDYFYSLSFGNIYKSLKELPNNGDTVILLPHSYPFKVLDNSNKLFIQIQSNKNPDYIFYAKIYELGYNIK